MRILLLHGIFCGLSSAANFIYAASYSGTVSTLSSGNVTGIPELSVVSETKDCGRSPTWLTLDREHGSILCLNEGIGASNGSITSFQISPNGSLTTLHTVKTISGPVMSALYKNPAPPQQYFVAVAHYEGSAVTSFAFDPKFGRLSHFQTFSYHLSSPGPVPDRQDAPHPHGTIVDPTGRFILVPDLGMDRIHIFRICPSTGRLRPQKPLLVTPGSGPRHGMFWAPTVDDMSSKNTVTIFHLVSELSNTLSGFRVEYIANSIDFTKIYEHSTYGTGGPPSGSKASGISISPENDRILVSNRGDATFGKHSDSFAVFSCAMHQGFHSANVSFIGLFPAYGDFPREFDINGKKNQIAVALQNSHEVALVQWSPSAKTPGKALSRKALDGEIVATVWGH